MAELKYGDKILVLGESIVHRGTLEESMTEHKGLYWTKVSGTLTLSSREEIFPDTREGKKELISEIENRIIALDGAKDQLFKELGK